MAEYIELKTAVRLFENFDAGRADGQSTMLTPEEFAEYLYEIPTADVAPVVRCGDCKHAERYERADGGAGYYCGHPQNSFTYGEHWNRVFNPAKETNDFCSCGERKDGGDG